MTQDKNVMTRKIFDFLAPSVVTKLVESQAVLQLPTAEQIAVEPPKAAELPQAHSVEDEIGYIGFEPVW